MDVFSKYLFCVWFYFQFTYINCKFLHVTYSAATRYCVYVSEFQKHILSFNVHLYSCPTNAVPFFSSMAILLLYILEFCKQCSVLTGSLWVSILVYIKSDFVSSVKLIKVLLVYLYIHSGIYLKKSLKICILLHTTKNMGSNQCSSPLKAIRLIVSGITSSNVWKVTWTIVNLLDLFRRKYDVILKN